jgi:outer membrane protein assembly factor BamB
MINGDAAHSSFSNIDLSFPLEVTQTFVLGYRFESGIVTTEDRLFLGDSGADSNRLVTADRMTGEVLWTFDVPFTGGGMAFIPAVAEGVVLIGGQGAPGLYALDTETGDSLWFLPVRSLYTRCPVISEGRVYQISSDSLSCIDLHTGDIFWSFRESMPQISPAVDDDRVYFASRAQMYAANKLNGEIAWVNDSVVVDVFMSIAVDDEQVYTGSERSISALSKATGETAWTHTLGKQAIIVDWPSAFVLAETYLLVKYMVDTVEGDQYLILDRATGSEVAQYSGASSITYSAPTIVNGYLIDYALGTLTFRDFITGSVAYELNGLPILQYPKQIVAVDNKIYLSGDGPNVLVLESSPSSTDGTGQVMDLALFPNPAHDQLNLSFTSHEADKLMLRVYASTGALIVQYDLGLFGAGDHKATIQIGKLTPGSYAASIMSSRGQVTHRFVIE